MQLHNRWVTLGIVLFTSDVNVQAKRMLCRMLRDRGFQLYPDSNLSIFLQHSQSVPIKPITILAHDKTDFKKIKKLAFDFEGFLYQILSITLFSYFNL